MTRLPSLFCVFVSISASLAAFSAPARADIPRPHIVLVMADDMGWGQTGYYNHPVLKTPNLDAMAANGLRFDRFYAGAPNCSPTRATVLTGRTNDRTGVENHGYALRRQEKTLPQALKDAGYATGHFGKWHLNGYRGPGAPILIGDDHGPGAFGFDTWLSVTNFFDLDPLLSRNGKVEEFEGDSSEIVIAGALKFITAESKAGKPTFSVIWFGTPHSPFRALEKDKSLPEFAALDESSQNHYGELVAMDRGMGTLRQGLRDLGIAENTLLWFCSDNGGLPGVEPGTVGNLRGFKNTMYEGGLRVPAIIEWPARIKEPRVTSYPAGTFDIFPTIADMLLLKETSALEPIDGASLEPVIDNTPDANAPREKPLVFRHQRRAVLIDNDFKILSENIDKGEDATFELYHLVKDPDEATNLAGEESERERFGELKARLLKFNASVDKSVAGEDYPEGKVDPNEPRSRSWTTAPEYESFLEQWKERPEFARYVTKDTETPVKKKPKAKSE